MLKRLKQPTGEVASHEPSPDDTENSIVRAAILVHSGPDGKGVAYECADDEVTKPFDAARIKSIVDIHNAGIDRLAKEYGGEEKIPAGAYNPILDNHENESVDQIVGRLACRLKYEVRDVPKVGKNVACAVATPGIKFLGKEVVERVKDGRLYHLSIGINEENDTLGETSVVIKPAAPGAMLLKAGKNNGGQKMAEVNETEKTMWKRLKAKFEKKVEKKVERKLASAERLATLKAVQEDIKKLSEASITTKKLFVESSKKGEITSRLKKLCAAGKMTPAEYRNLVGKEDLAHLAGLDEKTLKIALAPYESREKPVIDPRQLGTTDAVNFSDVGKNLEKTQFKQLKAEIRGDFKKLSGREMKMKDGYKDDVESGHESHMRGGNDLEDKDPGKNPHVVDGQAGLEEQEAGRKLAAHMDKMSKHMEAGEWDDAKEERKKMAAHMSKHGMKKMEGAGDVKSEDYKDSLSMMQQQIDEQATQMGRLAGVLEKIVSAEKEEAHGIDGIDDHEEEHVA